MSIEDKLEQNQKDIDRLQEEREGLLNEKDSQNRVYKAGDWFIGSHGEVLQLVNIGDGKFRLIATHDGNRMSDGALLYHVSPFTLEEVQSLTSSCKIYPVSAKNALEKLLQYDKAAKELHDEYACTNF